MADLTITIPTPTLVAGQYFRVEYRLVGAGSWTLYANQTNTPFSITGLTAGQQYEFRFTLLKSLSPLVECPAVIEVFTVPEETPCLEFDASIMLGDGGYYISIEASGFPSPYTPACGGYKVCYGIGQASTCFTVADFATQPVINIPISILDTYHVTIQAYNCTGQPVDCYDDELPVPSPVTYCTPATLVGMPTLYAPGLNYPTFTLTITINQSVPYQNPIAVSYSQTQAVLQGVPDPGGTVTFPGTNTAQQTVVLTVTPNVNVPTSNGQKAIRYAGTITDGCGHTIYWKAELSFAT